MTRARPPPPTIAERSAIPHVCTEEIRERSMENIAEMIREAKAPTGEMADLSGKAQRLGKALEVAEKWVHVATVNTEMFGRAQLAYDQLEEELSRTVFTMDVVSLERIIAHGQRERGEQTSPEELRRMSREHVVADELLAAYITLSHAPLEVFGVGDRPAEERTRYAMMGALLVAVDAANEAAEPRLEAKPASA
jgi:hypothetical protein